MSDCEICQKPDSEKPMCFRNEPWCSDRHRKMVLGEIPWAKKKIKRYRPAQVNIRSQMGDWEARNESDHDSLRACVLEKVENADYWQFSVTEGPFSGYPSVNLYKDDLIYLRKYIDEQLGESGVGKLVEIDRVARAYGWEIGREAEFAEVVETSDESPFLDPNWRKNYNLGLR